MVPTNQAGKPRNAATRTVLFTGGGGAGSEAIHRLLRDRYDVHFADADPEARPHPVPLRRWHAIPMASAPDFVDRLGCLCRRLGVDLLVPGVDEELLPISAARDAMPCDVLLPPADFVGTHLDKLASHALLRAHALPTPDTEPLTARRSVSFPCVVKPRRGRGSRDVAIVRSEQELQAHVVHCRRAPHDFIVQELLQGQEYTVMVAADREGRLRAVVPVRVDVKRGITLRAETDSDPSVTAACAAIHAACLVAGCFNVQAIRTDAGDVKPFEINPRISTTACLALAAGVDFIGLYLGAGSSSAEDRDNLAPFSNHLRLRRSWHNEFGA